MNVQTMPIDVSGRRAIRRAFRAMPDYSGAIFTAPADAVALALQGDPLLAAVEPLDDGRSLVRKHDSGNL